MIKHRQYRSNPKIQSSEIIPVTSILKNEQRPSSASKDTFSRSRTNPSNAQIIDVHNILSKEERS